MSLVEIFCFSIYYYLSVVKYLIVIVNGVSWFLFHNVLYFHLFFSWDFFFFFFFFFFFLLLLLLLLLLFTLLKFFTSVWADGFSQEFEWQEICSGLQDSSQYSGRSQQCSHLDSLNPSTNFIYSFRVFHINISSWFFTRVWVTASHLRSPWLFSVFWPFSVMLSFE